MNKVQTQIPEGWSEKTIIDMCEILDSKRIPLSDEERHLIKGDIPYYGANGVVDHINNYIFDQDLLLVAEDGGHFEEWNIKPIAYRVSGKSWINNHAHVLAALTGYSLDFIFYNLEHRNITYYISGGTRGKLNQSQLRVIPVAIPTEFKEQQKIAEVLSIIDEAIAKTDQLIAKYKSIKQGLMQDLFRYGIDENGQIRSEKTHKFKDSPLGSIPEEWNIEGFSSNISFAYGSGLKEEDRSGGEFPVFGSNGIVGFHKEYLVDGPGIVIGRKGTIGAVSWTSENFFPIDTTYYIKTNDNFMLKYLFYYLKTLSLDTLNSASGTPGLNREEVYKLKVVRPDLKEQKRILTVLESSTNVVDEELINVRKLESLKQGLMNDLLTGKVRANHLLN